MKRHVCPWYLGYVLASPLRRLHQNPEKILSPYIKVGMNILEVGPGMGYFSLPMARLVGETGKIYCIDIQERMLKSLRRRTRKKNLEKIIKTRLSTESSLEINDLEGQIDFALTFAVVHEVPDQRHLFMEINRSLRKDGLLLIAEPKGHVTKEEFDITLSIAKDEGMQIVNKPEIKSNYSAVLKHI